MLSISVNGEVDSNLRRRKGSRPERVEKLSPRADVGQRKINFSFSPSDSVQTDFKYDFNIGFSICIISECFSF